MGRKSLLAKKIYNYLKTLKKGEITTYKKLAEKFNSHPRAIARILASNKDKSVPCYKVIRSDGERLRGRGKKINWNNPCEVARLLGGYNGLLGKSKERSIEEEGII